ncbi:Uncharacterised protein [Candidatus Ornithobacterium hominis]|uniref:hypothetical protein n=1 Tax=Candidatus Ornithobacterium hominis TaxID=2497989 RepID=UPI000E5AFE0C|nr:hypothetical protein [Candidatus Ornithobacterium hominis]SZD73877.1 Uncharacterised protein [Candidatus Ornithobacterium hominis]
MNKILKITLVLLFSVFLFSCNEDESLDQSPINENLITSFNKSSTTSRNSDVSEVIVFSDMTSSDENLSGMLEGLIVSVDLDAMKATFTNENEAGSIEFDLIENENSTLSLSGYTAKKNGLSDRTPRWLCGASCVGQGFLISLWDGPAPLMDIAAAAYTYAYASDC